MTRPEPVDQIAFGQISLARTPVANRIYERQQLVERGVTQRGMRHAFVKWREPDASGITFVAGPNRRQVVRGGDFTFQRLGRIGSGNTSRHFSMFSGKCILQSM